MLRELVLAIARGLLAGAVGAAIGAVTGAASGATGAALLRGVEYTDHDVSESAKIGALGNALMVAVASFSAAANSRTPTYFFAPRPRTISHICVLMLTFSLLQALGSALGYGLLSDDMTTGSLESVCADTALGSEMLLVPFALIAACLIACYCPQSTAEEQQQIMQMQ